jgi:hypothetical protein
LRQGKSAAVIEATGADEQATMQAKAAAEEDQNQQNNQNQPHRLKSPRRFGLGPLLVESASDAANSTDFPIWWRGQADTIADLLHIVHSFAGWFNRVGTTPDRARYHG